jgi:two-component system, OmpR family, phosphate regulon response regulator OmpR
MPSSVLVVDDDPAIRELVLETLTDEGYAVTVVEDGMEALRLVQKLDQRPDLVLTDIVMPKLSGPELHARLRLIGYHGPVVLMSAHHHRVDQFATPVIRKPFRLETLLQIVGENIAT